MGLLEVLFAKDISAMAMLLIRAFSFDELQLAEMFMPKRP